GHGIIGRAHVSQRCQRIRAATIEDGVAAVAEIAIETVVVGQRAVGAARARAQRILGAGEAAVERGVAGLHIVAERRAVARGRLGVGAAAEQGAEERSHQGISPLSCLMMSTTAFSQRYQSGFIRPSGSASGTLASGIGGMGGVVVGMLNLVSSAAVETARRRPS